MTSSGSLWLGQSEKTKNPQHVYLQFSPIIIKLSVGQTRPSKSKKLSHYKNIPYNKNPQIYNMAVIFGLFKSHLQLVSTVILPAIHSLNCAHDLHLKYKTVCREKNHTEACPPAGNVKSTSVFPPWRRIHISTRFMYSRHGFL